MSNLQTHNDGGINPAPVPILFETSTAEIDAVLQQSRVAPAPVEPSITATSTFVMVPKLYTTPARVEISLRVDSNFNRTGILSPSGNLGAIQIFKSAIGGTRMAFDGQDNEFQGQELEIGVTLFAQGIAASAALDDFTLTLDLAAGPTPIGGPVSISLTAVALTLDICVPRTASGADPPALLQPTTSQPPAGTNIDKWFGGRLVNEQDNILSQERAMLIVRQPRPAAFNGQLVLRGVEVNGTSIGALTDKARLFDSEAPNLLQLPFGNRHQFSGVTGPNGVRFFVQGANPSAVRRDVGFQLGIAGVEDDGDRVAVTVGVAPVIALASAVVVVKKPSANPTRRAVTLRTSSTFSGTGTLRRSGNTAAIKLFKSDGTELSFTPNPVFTDLELSDGGVQLLAEGATASGGLNDYQLTLSLTAAGAPQVGNAVNARMTAVDLTLDICVPRSSPTTDPLPLSATDKISVGRFVQVRDPGLKHQRALLIVRRPNPMFNGTLVLARLTDRVQALEIEAPAAGQVAILNPRPIATGDIPVGGQRFFVEGLSSSVTVRDTGYQIGIQGQADADRALITTVTLALTNNIPPFDTILDRAQIEGVLNASRASYDIGDLYGDQSNFLFRVRADIPGITGNTVSARLIGRRVDGTDINPNNVTLTRTTGNRFASLPILAIPEAFPRSDITFRAIQDIDVIQCTAGGRLRAELAGTLAGVAATEARVRGRVVRLNVTIISTSGVTATEVNDAVSGANRIWAQAGIELRLAGSITNTADPGGLDIIEALPATFFNNLGAERVSLFNLNPTAGNVDVYYVQNIIGVNGNGFGSNDLNPPMAAFGADLVIRQGVVGQNTLAHELGHILIDLPRTVNGGGQEHDLFTFGVLGGLTSGAAAPAPNIMHGQGIAGRNELTSDQCLRAQANGLVVFVE